MHTAHTIPLPGDRSLTLGRTALVMGILNVTPDSFSDGGKHVSVEAAVAHARAMIAEGADIIDVGGESTRPGAEPVSTQEELDRVIPVLEALIAVGITTPISIDTYKPLVCDQAIQSGAVIVNDVHGLQGAPEMADIVALYDVPVIAMHWDRERDQTAPLVNAMQAYFAKTRLLAEHAGIAPNKIILDPGFGFAKSLAENYALLPAIQQACSGMPIVAGTSRKSMIGKILADPGADRLAGTIATSVLAYVNGAHILRVHDVRANRDALRVGEATLYGPPENLE